MERIFRLMQMGWSTDHRPNPASLVHQRERFSDVFRTIRSAAAWSPGNIHRSFHPVIRTGMRGAGRAIPREGAVISGRPVRGASSWNIPAELSCGDSGVREIFTGRIISCPSCVTPEGSFPAVHHVGRNFKNQLPRQGSTVAVHPRSLQSFCSNREISFGRRDDPFHRFPAGKNRT